MGIFKVQKKNLAGELVGEYEFPNTILDIGLEYLCTGSNANFNSNPFIAVGTSDITPDTNQSYLINPVQIKAATFTPGTSTTQNPSGDKQFIASVHFNANEAIGDLTEISYVMYASNSAGANPVPLNRTLFQIPGQLNTLFPATPELDQYQNTDVTNLQQVYGVHWFSQTFTPSASAANVSEIAINLASSGNPGDAFHISLCQDNAGQPGTVLASATIAQFAEPVQRWRIGKFGSPVAVTAGQPYHIVVSSPGTDLANCYDMFGSNEDVYGGGQLLASSDSGTTYAALSPSQDMGFKTYFSGSGATAHDYVLTMVQFDKETAISNDVSVTAFPENNLDAENTSQGTIRLTLPTYVELPPYTESLNLYKDVSGTKELLATLGTVRQYFYDNGTVTPVASSTPPGASSIAAPTGLASVIDTTNGGPLNFSQNKYYKVSAVQFGPPIYYQESGPFQNNSGVSQFYTTQYQTQTLPLSATYYETAASAEYTLTAPTTGTASFNEYFSNPTLDSTLWNYTNNNSDYFSIVKPSNTNENQLQLNVPAGVPYVISSTRKAGRLQTYYLTFFVPWLTTPKPFTLYDTHGNPYTNPIYTDSAPNRVGIFGFVNPNNINTLNADKRLSLEVGYYHDYRTEDQTTTGDTATYAHGPMWCLYDNLGNPYFFAFNDLQPSHSDGAYSLKIDILQDGTMQVSWLNPNNRTFQVLTSSLYEFNFHTQYNGSHLLINGGHPGPATQTTNHFVVPANYNFALGNPSNDSLAFSQVNYISVNDSIFTIPGTFPLVPVPAVAMRAVGYNAAITWNAIPGARKYRVYTTATSGSYSSPSMVYDYDQYYPCYAVQSTESANNDWFNQLVATTGTVRNWTDFGVTYGVNTTSTGDTNSYALAGFVGSNAAQYGNPLVPSIAAAPGSAEGYLLLLNATNQVCMFTFMGGGFELRAETGPDRGIGQIYIDGNYVQDVDFYSAERNEQVSVFRTDVLSKGIHYVQVVPKVLGGAMQANDFSLGTSIALDFFRITVPAITDFNLVQAGVPGSVNDPNIAPVPPPSIKGTKAYNGNGPTVVTKDPQHTLDVTMTFSLINPNL